MANTTLHPLLTLGSLYTKLDLSDLLNEPNLKLVREGIYSSTNSNSILLFVDLVKAGKEERFHFNDYFQEDYFHWDSQTTQNIESERSLVQKLASRRLQISKVAWFPNKSVTEIGISRGIADRLVATTRHI